MFNTVTSLDQFFRDPQAQSNENFSRPSILVKSDSIPLSKIYAEISRPNGIWLGAVFLLFAFRGNDELREEFHHNNEDNQ